MWEPDVWRVIKKDEYGNWADEMNNLIQSKYDEEMMKKGWDF